MRNLKKRSPIFDARGIGSKKAFYILIPLMLLAFHVWPSMLGADHQERRESHYKNEKKHHEYSDRKGKARKENEGNEATGQTAAWLFAAANLTVAVSILIKGVSRYIPLEPKTKSSFQRFNRFQKKYLMSFHYALNPLALCIAISHFLLSSCRRSSLPEWSLLFVTVMVFLGLMTKFKATPRWMRRLTYRLHTFPVVFSALILVLVVGHLIVD